MRPLEEILVQADAVCPLSQLHGRMLWVILSRVMCLGIGLSLGPAVVDVLRLSCSLSQALIICSGSDVI